MPVANKQMEMHIYIYKGNVREIKMFLQFRSMRGGPGCFTYERSKLTSLISLQSGSLFGNKIACRLTPKLIRTTANNTTK